MDERNRALYKRFKSKLTKDHLFTMVNLELLSDERREVVIPGNLVEGFLYNGHYDIDYLGPNVSRDELEQMEQEEAKTTEQLKELVTADVKPSPYPITKHKKNSGKKKSKKK